VKDLSTSTKLNPEIIANLSNIIRENIVYSHDHIQQVTGNMIWLNITIYEQNTLYSTIKQMVLTLSQLSQHVDDLFDAVQYSIQRKLPLKLISPIALQNILRNVTLKLPEGYELIAGTSLENIHLYYDLVRFSVVANVHSIKLLLRVPLKPANRHFTLFRIITFPIRFSSDKYVQYVVEHAYLGIQHSQQAYILLSETSFNRCKRSTFTICPADITVYRAQALTCEFSLYFQKRYSPFMSTTPSQPQNAICASSRINMGISFPIKASDHSTLPRSR
jgi:hypothetical protein